MKVQLPYALDGVQPGNPVEVPDAEARSLLRQGIAKPVGDTEAPDEGSDDQSEAQSPSPKPSGKSRTRKATASTPAGDGEDGEPADEQAADTDTKEA